MHNYDFIWGSQRVLAVKNPPVNAGDIRDMDLTPGLGRPLEEGMATHTNILAWRIPWTEKPGGLHFIGHKELDTAEATKHARHY